MHDFLPVYITFATRDEAEHIGRTLVEEKLAACVNILSPIHSIYRWQGKVEAVDEIALIAKTHAPVFVRLEKRVKELHSYECPCIVAWPIAAGHAPYLNWIAKETEHT